MQEPETPKERRRIHVEETLTVLELWVHQEQPVTLDFGGEESVRVVFRQPTQDEVKRGSDPSNANAVVTLLVDVPKKSFTALQEMAAGRLPTGSGKPDESCPWVKADGTFNAATAAPPLWIVPNTLQEFWPAVKQRTVALARQAEGLARWRLGQGGPHDAVRSKLAVRWSFDGAAWFHVPSNPAAQAADIPSLRPRPRQLQDLVEMGSNGIHQPIGHELLREAIHQQSANPRSALVIGVAAAEVATKRCMMTLVPECEWLVLNLQSPPIEMFLGGFFRSIAERHNNVKMWPVPDELIQEVKTAVGLRNRLVHRGESPAREKVRDILRTVRDLLYLLDAYAGHGWAVSFLSPTMKQKLNVDTAQVVRAAVDKPIVLPLPEG